MIQIEQQLKVRLAFPAMARPVEVAVPWNVLRYLDVHAERRIDTDGTVVYVLPEGASLRGQQVMPA